ncbi:MAG: type II toxin-antitoxin system RelE family toxin [Gulosibacter sp.]|uniref:type II toxin-antitoxin system RelE family toxin n=1 Tax=Gulosibacter sp. TaxID=2817531 RepID=UPI003F922BF6
MTYRVQVTPKALKQIAQLDRPVQQRIKRFLLEGIDRENPRASGRSLVASPYWRYRVGDYRLLAAIEDDTLIVLVVAAEHRRSVYRDM